MKKMTLYVPGSTPRQVGAAAKLDDTLLGLGGVTSLSSIGRWKDLVTKTTYTEPGEVMLVLVETEEHLTAVLDALHQYGRDAGETAVAWDVVEVEAKVEAVRRAS